MKLENHITKLKEHLEGLDWGIKQDNQSSVGFHASAGMVELLSIYLHKLKLVPGDFQLKHNWFNSETTVREKLNFDFPRKNTILGLMMKIEEMRNPLCYGAPRAEVVIDAMTTHFHDLKELVEHELGEKLD